MQFLFKLEKNRVNCQEVADCISELSQQNINHFINSEHWSYRDLMDEIAQDASRLFEQSKQPVALLFDEVGIRKKGKMSACVARQYLGCIGKVDNGQVAVCAGLAQGQNFTPIEMRLFMPEEWDQDASRRRKCNIPDDEQHIPKPALVQKMVEHILQNKIAFDYINFDALYGNAKSLLAFLVSNKLDFIGDVRSDFTIHFDYDKEEKCTVGQYLKYLSNEDFDKVTIRQATKGSLQAYFHRVKVQIRVESKWLDLILLIRKDMDGKIKFSISNMDQDHIQELAKKQGQRIFIEQIFKEGKNQVGMADYQIRGWNGFHNHIALVMLAMLLIAKIKIEYHEEKYTTNTVRKLISLCIINKMEHPQIAIAIILEQHRRYIKQLERDGFFQQSG